MSAQITYGSYAFHTKGANRSVLHGVNRTFENAEDGRAIAVNYTFSIRFELFGDTFAAIEGELKTLRAYLDANPEAVLLITDENGATLHNRRVRILSEGTGDQDWRQYSGPITLTFTARDTSLASSAADATFTPTGGSAVTLHNIAGSSESKATERYDPNFPNRRSTRVNITMNGTILADQSQDEATRRAALNAAKQTFQTASNAKNGSLVWAGETRLVEVTTLDASLAGDGSHRLEWSAQFSYRAFPDGDFAEVEFTAAENTNRETGDATLTVAGTIRALSESTARTKAAAIKAHYLTGRALLSDEITPKRHHGADSDPDLPGDVLELSFSFQFRDTNASVLNWELSIDTKTDDRTGLKALSYSGRVIASTDSAALAKARELGDGKHNFRLSASEKLDYRKMGDNDSQRFVQCSFTYDYEARDTGIVSAEISSQTVKDPFGPWTLSLSGSCVASSKSAAETLARGLKTAPSTSYVITQDNEGYDESYRSTPGREFRRFTFSYAWQFTNSSGSAEFTVADENDWSSGNASVTVSGIVRGSTKSACVGIANSIGASYKGSLTLDREGNQSKIRTEGGRTLFEELSFVRGYVGKLSGTASIVDAEFTIEKTYSVANAVFTPIPYDVHHVQPDTGTTPGECRISGTATGSSKSALESWATGKRSLAPGSGYESPGTMAVTEVSPRFNPALVQLYRVNFSWSWRYPELAGP